MLKSNDVIVCTTKEELISQIIKGEVKRVKTTCQQNEERKCEELTNVLRTKNVFPSVTKKRDGSTEVDFDLYKLSRDKLPGIASVIRNTPLDFYILN